MQCIEAPGQSGVKRTTRGLSPTSPILVSIVIILCHMRQQLFSIHKSRLRFFTRSGFGPLLRLLGMNGNP
jgi:hypothetical protein